MIVGIGGPMPRHEPGEHLHTMAPPARFVRARRHVQRQEKADALDEVKRAEAANVEPPSDAELVDAAKRILEEG
jgi:hypothetical protein